MYRLLAIAKYEERYVIPPAHAEQAHALEELATECSLDYEGGPGMGGSGPFGESSGGVDADRGGELPHAQAAPDRATTLVDPTTSRGRVNLLNWDGKGAPEGLFPPRGRAATATPTPPRPRRGRGAAAAAGCATGSGRRPHARLALAVASSLLLGYPDDELLARLPAAAPRAVGAAGRRRRRRCARLLDHLARPRSDGCRRDYVDDVRPAAAAAACYLTYYAHGDTRKRGMALLRFKQAYRRAGLELDDATSCPTTCASCSSSPPPSTRRAAGGCCCEHRAGLELLRLALADAGSPYAAAVAAVSRDPAAAARRRARRRRRGWPPQGPPGEEVGLEPFGPPELTAGARR